jgi:tetratricopeptide (TPR) repeat protein
MSRRRRGLFSRLFENVAYLGSVVLSWITWPYYATLDVVSALFGGSSGNIQRRSWSQFFLDILLFIPRWVGIFLLWVYQLLLLWPRMMRLRDLASGLPALLAALAAGFVLFFFEKDESKLISSYEVKSNKAYEKTRRETDVKQREADLKLAQFYARALVKLKDEDPTYRFNVAYIYQEMGEHNRAQAIMDGLAPRNNQGFAKAHLWQADQLLSPDRPLTSDSLDAAEAHLLQALATYNEPQEIHRRLGELYYYRYVRYNSRNRDPWVPAREIYLSKAEYHLSQVADVDTKLALTLAEIRGLQGRTRQAELDVQTVVGKLTARLASVPDDLESRLLLARAYRMVRQFAEAANVLREGRNIRPDVRLDQELSSIYYFLSLDYQQRNANSLPEQFAALQDAYRAFPTNNYVAHRFVQALSSPSAEEAEFARSALQSLVDNRTPGQLATLFLGFDCLRRTLPAKAEDYFRTIRGLPSDGSAEVMAGLATAVLAGQVKSLNPSAVNTLFEASLRVWPDNADLLAVRAQQHLLLRQYATALSDLLKALERSPRNVKLHEMIAVTYQQLGQPDKAREHHQKAAQFRANASPPAL